MMTSKERVEAVLAGRWPDRPPYGFWYHFPADQVAGPGALQAHLDLFERFGLDFLKVMNDNPYPHAQQIQWVEDLTTLRLLQGDEEGFGRQLQLLAALKACFGDRVYLVTTIFNAWTVLRLLVEPPSEYLPPRMEGAADPSSLWIREAFAQRPDVVTSALQIIGQNMASFARRCIQAGADGIFLSVRDDWVGTAPPREGLFSLYDRIVRPADMAILQAVHQAPFNILHICGRAVDFRTFAAYPVAVVNWADRAAGPAIRDVKGWLKPAICGGVDNLGTLVSGTPQQVQDEVRDALAQAGGRPMIVAPGCTFDRRRTPEANLAALVEAVRAYRR